MKTLRKEKIQPEYFDDFLPPYEQMIEGKIYISKEYETSIHRCLCGCGNKTVLPLGKNEWTLTDNEGKKVSGHGFSFETPS